MTDTNRTTPSSNGQACRLTCWRSSACWWESRAAGSSADPRVQRPLLRRRRAHPHPLPRMLTAGKPQLRLRCRRWPTLKLDH